jgi:hypothetical protein
VFVPRAWDPQRHNEVRRRYDAGASANSIARSIGADPRTVRASLRRTGGTRSYAETRARATALFGREAEVVAARETGMSLAAIGAEFGVDAGAVAHCLKRVGREISVREAALRRARLRNPGASYFRSIADEEQAYWLGFITADGYLTAGTRSVRFGVELAGRDHTHLARLASRHGLSMRSTSRGFVKVASDNMALVHDLRIAGITERKSRDRAVVRALFRTPAGLRRHFVRGLFDGDGSAFAARSGTRALEFSGHVLMLKAVRELVVRELAVARNQLVRPVSADPGFVTLRWRHPLDLAKLAVWMYDGASVWLERKRAVLERPAASRSASIYRGVYRRRGRWAARVGVGGRAGHIISAGTYDDEVSAARGYDQLARALLGPHAPLNLPDSPFCDPDVLAARLRDPTHRVRSG